MGPPPIFVNAILEQISFGKNRKSYWRICLSRGSFPFKARWMSGMEVSGDQPQRRFPRGY